ncbi:metal ABC transporter permease [bacterium]|jgi:manganese/zinc/iron transport system permease protein|nr:metal ABC transporter permease [bacterium]MBT6294040.1 metal ABC transporter permease [bacterium]
MLIYFSLTLFALVAALYGNFCVFQKQGLIADVLGHSVFPAVIVSVLLTNSKSYFYMMLFSFIFSFLSFSILNYLKKNILLDKDSIMAIVLSGFFGLGTLLMSVLKKNSSNLLSGVSDIFYGNVSAISSGDLRFILFFSLLSLFLYYFLRRYLIFSSFDSTFFRFKFNIFRIVDFIFYFILTFLVTLSINLVGIVLTSGLFIIPCLVSYKFSNNYTQLELLSSSTAVFSCFIGILISSNFNSVPTGPLIVISLGILFFASRLININTVKL